LHTVNKTLCIAQLLAPHHCERVWHKPDVSDCGRQSFFNAVTLLFGRQEGL